MSTNRAILTQLFTDFTEPIRDPVWKNITLSRSLKAIIGTEPFQQLSEIKQLGPIYLVYPGATHTRFNHSLGVFHLAKRIIQHMLRFEEFRIFTPEGVRAFLCAALLHDLGHFPYAHSLKELPLKDHEQLTAEIILTTELESTIRTELGTDPRMVAAIVDLSMEANYGPELPFYRNILSGVLDPDKLDYLTRDAFFCGIPYGLQDTDFIISKIHPHPRDGIALDQQGLSAVENLLFSKYMMYRNVYWHKTVRIATAMIKKAILNALWDGEIRPEGLYGLSDKDFLHTVQDRDYPFFELIRNVFRRRLHKAVYSTPFEVDNPRHQDLLDLEKRAALETDLIRAVNADGGPFLEKPDLVIDVPEPISFEIDIPIMAGDDEVAYSDSDSVFTPPVISGFSTSLRHIQIFVTSEKADHLAGRNWEI